MIKQERIGNQTLILGDCLEVMPTLGVFDCCVTDPPYEFDTQGAGIFRTNRKNMDQIKASGLDKGFDCTIFKNDQFGAVVFFCHNDQLPDILNHISEEFERFAVCAWHKKNPMPVANRHYQPDTEFWVHGWNKSFYPVGELSEKKRYWMGNGGQDATISHPTVKPIPLMEKIVTNVFGQTILDPFMGSGTTLVACQKLGRFGTGIERDPQYFQIACERVHDEWSRPDMFTSEAKEETPQQIDLLEIEK